MGVAALERAGGVVLRHQSIAVVEEPGRRRAARYLPQPAERVEAELGAVGAARRDEAVLDVVEERRGAVGREVAVGVVGERCGARRSILVEPVDGVDPVVLR